MSKSTISKFKLPSAIIHECENSLHTIKNQMLELKNRLYKTEDRLRESNVSNPTNTTLSLDNPFKERPSTKMSDLLQENVKEFILSLLCSIDLRPKLPDLKRKTNTIKRLSLSRPRE